MFRKLPTIVVFLILLLELVLAWQLHLPEGWPRFVAAFIVLLTMGLLYLVAHKAAKEKLL
jgi:uncharacterized membrane protein YoaK (UPF0700 family)